MIVIVNARYPIICIADCQHDFTSVVYAGILIFITWVCKYLFKVSIKENPRWRLIKHGPEIKFTNRFELRKIIVKPEKSLKLWHIFQLCKWIDLFPS